MSYEALRKALVENGGVDSINADGVIRFMTDNGFKVAKDTIPNGGVRDNTGWLYDGGPFSMVADEPISTVVHGGSALAQWIPTRTVKTKTSSIAHLEWVAPEGFDGSQTYAEWLAGIDIAACGYGPSTSWSGFEYLMSGGQFSWTTTNMKPIPDGGVMYHEQQPIYTVRGSSVNMPLTSDQDWAVARTLMACQTHLDYVLKFGNLNNSQMEWDGLEQIVTQGYVQSRKIGSGIPHWADPLVVNGSVIITPGQLLQQIRAMVRRLRRRVRDRNWTIASNDMVVYMSSVMWDNLAESIAAGAMYQYTNQYSFDGQQSFRDFRAEYNATKQGGIGFGTIDIDGEPIPVLVDSGLGMNVTIDPGGANEAAAVAGDVYILTRRANGITLLEQQYIDWRQLDYPAIGENQFPLQGGIVRAGWITEANKCYYYYAEMAGRLVTYMQPLQARINNVVIPTLDTMENESGFFYSPDFYAYNGTQGGFGTSLITPV